MLGIDDSIIADLRQNLLLREGHFAYRSGRHSAGLLDRDLLLADPGLASHLGYAVAKRYFGEHVETVAAASIWGAGLAQWVAYFLEPKAKVVYAGNNGSAIGDSPKLVELITDQRVLLVDNLVLTGATMTRFAGLMGGLGADIVGIGTLWSSADNEIAGLPVFSLLSPIYQAFPANDCPMCAAADREPEQVPY